MLVLRVRVFHQDALFADALSAVLESEGFEVGGAETLDEAVRTAPTGDAVIVDMRALGALEAVHGLSERSPDLRVVGCIEANVPRQIAALMKVGATAWISTADGVDRLVYLLRKPRSSLPGGTRIDRSPSRRVATTVADRYGLTAREMEVLQGLARGASTGTLASTLRVSPATARTHVHNVLVKLGVHTRLEAVAYAIEHHLVQIDDLANDQAEMSG